MARLFLTIISLFIMMPLAGCVGVSSLNASLNDEVLVSNKLNVFYASVRKKDLDGSFGTGRADSLSYGSYLVSAPSIRRAGKFIYPQKSSDIKRAFRTLASQEITSANAFNRAVINEAQKVRNSREVMIFVHGFNYNFEKGIYRLAALDDDFKIPAASVLYSWPSASETRLYLHDIDAAFFARDGLERLVTDLSKADIDKITLVGHSMGASIIVETLRQLKFKGKDKVLSKIGGVSLLSPDIDVELFAQMAKDIGRLPQPFIIYTSKEDWALRGFADFFHEGKERLGNITDFAPLKDLDITIIDSSNIHDTSDSYHLAAATSPAFIALINSIPKVGFASFGAYAKAGKIIDAEIISNGEASVIVLGGL
jgi:esterase/lipase superfamily enzyme